MERAKKLRLDIQWEDEEQVQQELGWDKEECSGGEQVLPRRLTFEDYHGTDTMRKKDAVVGGDATRTVKVKVESEHAEEASSEAPTYDALVEWLDEHEAADKTV